MNKSLIILFGYFFIFIGFIFLFIPLIYLEVGRSKDLMIAALNLLIGFILIIKNKVFENLSTIACFLIIILMAFYVAEIVSFRWNQLTEKEKNKFTTFGEFKKNMSKIIEALKLGLGNFQNYFNFDKFSKNNENINKKKWVRNDKSDNIKA